jgi:hypothetical protein
MANNHRRLGVRTSRDGLGVEGVAVTLLEQAMLISETPDNVAKIISGKELAKHAWNEWSQNGIDSVVAMVAACYIVDQLLMHDRDGIFRAAIQAALDEAAKREECEK